MNLPSTSFRRPARSNGCPALRSAPLALALLGIGSSACHDHDHGAEHGHAHGAAGHAHPEPEAEAGHGHGHDHGGDAIGVTRWTDRLELFAEYPPAVEGEELPFLAHLTVLEGFAALEQATVTLVLDGPTHVEAKVERMLRSGIFRPTLTAPRAGLYQARLLVRGPVVNDDVDGFEIQVHGRAEAATEPAETESGAEPISYLKEQQWKIPFATVFAKRGMLTPTIEVAAEVSTPPSGQAEVGAAVAGRVVAPSGGLPRPGQVLRRGELLATIAPAPATPEAAARAELAVVEAEARVQAASSAFERAERLIADRAISQRELDATRRELRVAKQAVQAAQRARDVFVGASSGRGRGTYRVTAPIDGVLVEITTTAGRSVRAGEPMFRVVNLDELWIRGRVPEREAARLNPHRNAAYKLPGLDTWLPLEVEGEAPTASLITVGRTVDRRSRTVDIIYSLPSPEERLRVGAMLRLAVPAGEPRSAVIVPRGALIDDDGRTLVYVQVEGEAFEERSVRVGPRSGDRVGILSGLEDGERVVTVGANVIRLSSRSASAPAHGHVH